MNYSLKTDVKKERGLISYHTLLFDKYNNYFLNKKQIILFYFVRVKPITLT